MLTTAKASLISFLRLYRFLLNLKSSFPRNLSQQHLLHDVATPCLNYLLASLLLWNILFVVAMGKVRNLSITQISKGVTIRQS